MTRFHQGPADGQTLMIARAPRFLRVVQDKGGKIDALDQIGDTPEASETILVYEVEGEVGNCHINRGRGKSGWFVVANYRLFPNQPDDSEVRSTEAWEKWCWGIAQELSAKQP